MAVSYTHLDLDFLVFRFDWGVALHDPYDTGKKGYYNIPKFKDGMAWHFAIGYPNLQNRYLLLHSLRSCHYRTVR